MIWHYLLPIIMSIVFKLNMQLSVALRVIYRFRHMVILTLRWFVWNKKKIKKCVGLVHFRSHAFFKKMPSRASVVPRLQVVFNLLKKITKNKQEQKIYLSTEKTARFWKEITSSFSLKKIHWSIQMVLLKKCVYTWRVNDVPLFSPIS